MQMFAKTILCVIDFSCFTLFQCNMGWYCSLANLLGNLKTQQYLQGFEKMTWKTRKH